MSLLLPQNAALLLIDCQEALFSKVDRCGEVLQKICLSLEMAKAFELPVVVTEQYPKGLGATIEPIKERLPKDQLICPKTHFSAPRDPDVGQMIEAIDRTHWILVGVEAHICVLQSAKTLLERGKEVVILNDAVSSISLFDFSTGLSEAGHAGARISSTQTVLYELMGDSNAPQFSTLLPLMKHG